MTRKLARADGTGDLDNAVLIAAVRREVLERMRGDVATSAAPIRAMARLVGAIEAECRQRGISEAAIREHIINRTIGDIDVRRIVEHDARHDYRTLADELGVALSGEEIAGTVATGERYRGLRARMEAIERDLLQQGVDLHIYDLLGAGNRILRAWLCEELAQWGIAAAVDRVYIANGSLDALDKAMRGLRATIWAGSAGMIFPSPGFNVPEWEARTLGITPIRVRTSQQDGYKITAEQVRATLQKHPEARGLYLVLSNNPTAYSYQPEDLEAILAEIIRHPDMLVFADMAYTGTGDLAAERARVAVLARPEYARQIISFWSLSKVYTMTGDRFGWMCVGDPEIARTIPVAYANTIASPPAEWQLRFMATYELLRDHPEIREKISALYQLRRQAFIRQLKAINAERSIFARINLDNGGTVYNWSQLRPEVTVFDLFAATGIAGVPGSAFGYSDDHVRFSVGIVPAPGWERIAHRRATTTGVHSREAARV